MKGNTGVKSSELVVYRRGRACQVVYLINLQHQLLYHVMSYNFEVALSQQMLHIFFAASEEVVHANHLRRTKSEDWKDLIAEAWQMLHY